VITFTLNGGDIRLDTDPQTPLLWVLRDTLRLTGTKFGCGMGLCGACTVHLDGTAVRSCALPLAAVAGKAITTIEGLGGSHPLQQAWVAHNVPQCGYCQSGQIMSAAALLAVNPAPDEDSIREAMAGNLCRCGTYHKVQQAILSVAAVAHWEPTGESDS
jgi:aerobic-type carbon monoxide dehydrogenase small subunit (CoxS/CutS family)